MGRVLGRVLGKGARWVLVGVGVVGVVGVDGVEGRGGTRRDEEGCGRSCGVCVEVGLVLLPLEVSPVSPAAPGSCSAAPACWRWWWWCLWWLCVLRRTLHLQISSTTSRVPHCFFRRGRHFRPTHLNTRQGPHHQSDRATLALSRIRFLIPCNAAPHRPSSPVGPLSGPGQPCPPPALPSPGDGPQPFASPLQPFPRTDHCRHSICHPCRLTHAPKRAWLQPRCGVLPCAGSWPPGTPCPDT